MDEEHGGAARVQIAKVGHKGVDIGILPLSGGLAVNSGTDCSQRVLAIAFTGGRRVRVMHVH
jgi:hypothetical protein